jgi:hypothetical protein
MPASRAGHHGGLVYVFEDNGYNQSPTDETFKNFGSNSTLSTFEAGRQAERIFNTDRKAADIIRQNFDGGWEVTCNLGPAPWWLAGIFGQPASTEVTAPLYTYDYSLANDNDPVSLRLYLPTDGFNEYEVLSGAVIASVSIDQTNDASPDLTISGFYAEEPSSESTLDPVPPALSERTYSNRHAELLVDGTSVGAPQNTTVELAANNRPVQGFGSENVLDFMEGVWEPTVTWDKILATDQSVDPLARHQDSNQVTVSLDYDNGQTSSDEYTVNVDVTGAFPDTFSESGRNDPEADLTRELQEMGEDATVSVTTDAGDTGNPPGITL